ncbi:recombinase family protein [Bradyrhizobium sp. AZCC 2289]|uniref:helix-turn-helix domain-containing protein n=1 Tax=Bradyrhizobium sp. AZCC 2289 TaxID=3117026 RepID=UPI003FA5FC1B
MCVTFAEGSDRLAQLRPVGTRAAEFERSLIKARTAVGIRRAREAGVKFGRPSKLTKHQQQQAIKLLDAGEPQSAVARLFNVDQSTISRLIRVRRPIRFQKPRTPEILSGRQKSGRHTPACSSIIMPM